MNTIYKQIMTGITQKGAVLISLIVALVIMAVLGAGMQYYSSTSSSGELLANMQAKAYYLGESGANYALQQFIANQVTNGPYPALTTFTLNNGQFAVKTYDKPGDPTRLIIEATGIVGTGWSATRQLVTLNIVKASPNPPGGAPPTAPVGFDTNSNNALDASFVPATGTNVSIVSTGPSGGPAVQFKGDTSAISLAWNTSAGQTAGAPNLLAAWNNNGQLLSYALQVKIKIDRQGSKGQHYMAGLTFRIVDDNNSYGLSFYRSSNDSGPTWWSDTAFADIRNNVINNGVLNDGNNYAVLWKKSGGIYTLLAYALMSYNTYGVTDATSQTLNDYAAIFINVNERFDGTPAGSRNNHLKAYVAGPSIYPLGTSNWNFSSFKKITWTWISANNLYHTTTPSYYQTAPATELLDNAFTSEGFNVGCPDCCPAGSCPGSCLSCRPEIGVHAFYDSNAANDQFFNGFGMAAQGTSSTGGSGGYQY